MEALPVKRQKIESFDRREISWAVKNGEIEKLKRIHAMGYDLKQHKPKLLPTAAQYDQLEVVEFFLTTFHANSSAADMGFPLQVALERNNIDCAKMILKHKSQLANVLDSRRRHPITLAAEAFPEDYEFLNHLMDLGADVNFEDASKRTPLHHIGGRGDLRMMPRLLENTRDVNACDNRGQTALSKATLFGSKENMRMLIANGADPTIPAIKVWSRFEMGMTKICPLRYVARQGLLSLVKILAEVKLEQHIGCLAADDAAIHGHYRCFEYLLRNGFPLSKCSASRTFSRLEVIRFSTDELAESFLSVLVHIAFRIRRTQESLAISEKRFVTMCNLGIVEFETNRGPESFNNVQSVILLCYEMLIHIQEFVFFKKFLFNFKIYLRYFPYCALISKISAEDELAPSSASQSLISVAPKLVELCRWYIRCHLVQLNGYVCEKKIVELHLPKQLKKFLYYS